MVFQTQRDISSVSQGALSLTAYPTKLTKLWNELARLAPVSKCSYEGCTCGVNKAIADRTESTQVMQFLMGLHKTFESERSQILMQDPIPDVEKAFSMVFAVEKQRVVQLDMVDSSSYMACQSSLKENRREGTDRNFQKCRQFLDKRGLVCTNCHKPEHSQETCFQLHGVPDWYKAFNDKKKRGTMNKNFVANVGEKDVGIVPMAANNVTEIMSELLKVLQRHNLASDPITNSANYIQLEEEFAGNVSNFADIELCY
ncbi:UNVERIFIED_CONTAM: hypothetical protein Sradi_4544900 [Sesamum radiatum]|uniref:Uncharacterized protein n=1 Tax=Sesamum radiatum TaxID=300843 RepID=A0AAW2ND19_SESRA